MEITKENLLKIKISDLDVSEWSQEELIEYVDYIKTTFSEYFADNYTNIGIYKLTSPSGKCYIGQSVNIKDRHYKYKILSCEDQLYLYNALCKYGWDAFGVEILADLVDRSKESIQLINLLEFLYIRVHKGRKTCYNLAYGGDSFCKHSKETILKLRLSKKCIKIDQYDLSGNFIKTYNSIMGASRDIGITQRPNIQLCLRGLQNTCGGFIFVKHGETLILSDKTHKSAVSVDQYSKKGEFIKTWGTIREAALTLDISKSGITDCLHRRKKSCGNCHWIEHGRDFDIKKYKKQTGKSNKKPIIQLTMDGEFIKEWPATIDAATELCISRSSISQCLAGRTKSSAKFKWIWK
jgi:group I intron endonuclease